jgi:hypothetical protein
MLFNGTSTRTEETSPAPVDGEEVGLLVCRKPGCDECRDIAVLRAPAMAGAK